MSHSLEDGLRDAGIECRVEYRERLAILILNANTQRLDAGMRRRAIQLARDSGFSHVSVELDPAGAALSRD